MSAPRTIYLVPARTSMPARSLPTQRAPVPRVIPTGHRPVQPGPSPCLKRPAATMTTPVEDPLEVLLNDGSGQGPPRKRERLNHLSMEEKLNRRKLKNRVAAQTARDRKKARSQRLEEVVRQLMDENQKLREENSRLRTEHKQREMTVESAAFISGPLPRVQVASLLPLLLLLSSTLFPKKRSTVSSKTYRATLTSTNSRVNSHLMKTVKTFSLWKAPLSRRQHKWDVP